MTTYKRRESKMNKPSFAGTIRNYKGIAASQADICR